MEGSFTSSRRSQDTTRNANDDNDIREGRGPPYGGETRMVAIRKMVPILVSAVMVISFRNLVNSGTNIRHVRTEVSTSTVLIEDDGHLDKLARDENSTDTLLVPTTDEPDPQNKETNDSNPTTTIISTTPTSNRTISSPNDESIDRQYLLRRDERFYSWYIGNSTDELKPDADSNGTILDFVIAGFAKCGTTTMEANLGYLAPMPVADICTPVHQTVYYSYRLWPNQYKGEGEEKLLRGTKCPQYVHGGWLAQYSKFLPRAKLIVGIRHPILWFQSFYNMQQYRLEGNFKNPYNLVGPCPYEGGCSLDCPHKTLFCVNRGRFHHVLARLGKTSLGEEERTLLAPGDPDGGSNVVDNKIRNPIFLYDQTTLGEEYLWEDLSSYLGVGDTIKHDIFHESKGRTPGKNVNFCDKFYDEFRAMMMPIAYNVSVWLQDYFVPASREREDVFISRPDTFVELVEDYKVDPCGKLERLLDGSFVLKNGTAFADRVK